MRIEISTMEKERTRIANDLHDDLGPTLSVIKFQIDNARDRSDQIQLQDASLAVDNLIQRMREISNNLMPSSLLRKGLFVSIQEFIRSLETTTNLKFQFSNNCNTIISHDVSINLYRIIKEVLHNGVKHSQATEIHIACSLVKNMLSIHYFDNGIGFEYEKTVSSSTGFGLRTLKSRIEIIGGNMTAESKPGKGTAFLFKIPLS
ncbi:MAG TPA: ATP-binding protein [Segetibacter sp.]